MGPYRCLYSFSFQQGNGNEAKHQSNEQSDFYSSDKNANRQPQ